MPYKKKLVGVPAWLKVKPSEKIEEKIKLCSYDFVFDKAKQNGINLSPTELLPAFIEILKDKDQLFRRIKESQMKVTFPFMDSIRLELRNKLDKLEK